MTRSQKCIGIESIFSDAARTGVVVKQIIPTKSGVVHRECLERYSLSVSNEHTKRSRVPCNFENKVETHAGIIMDVFRDVVHTIIPRDMTYLFEKNIGALRIRHKSQYGTKSLSKDRIILAESVDFRADILVICC